MATPRRTTAFADQLSRKLVEGDLKVISEALHPIAAKYFIFGIQINLDMNEIKKIEKQYRDPNECLLNVLSIRLKQDKALTWNDIDTALRSNSVSEPGLANEIIEHNIGIGYKLSLSQRGEIKIKRVSPQHWTRRSEEEKGQDSSDGDKRKSISASPQHYTQLREEGGQDSIEGDEQVRWKKWRKRERLESTSSSSDTDDSSRESDMMRNISESETKKLRKVFRCFFGKLCREIRDPVEMAAELQSKRLLSQSTMEEILTTPVSRQEKVIILVRSLQRRIKSRPDRIFGIVKYFLHIEAIGKEMWLETGK